MQFQSFLMSSHFLFSLFNNTPTTLIYSLSLLDALPISCSTTNPHFWRTRRDAPLLVADRKSTRLNSSHLVISYADFCLKKKKKQKIPLQQLYPTKLEDKMQREK